jgi:uncharacterized protein (TIGR00730 family)
MSRLSSICVFCGSQSGRNPAYSEAARVMGGELASRGIRLVFGGGRIGVMGAIADAALAAGGRVMGVIPKALADKEIAHGGVQELALVGSMHERKQLMSDNADAFVALPGGLGTLEELFEVLTWAQLGIHAKPVGLLNVAGYFDSLLAFLDESVAQGFIGAAERGRLVLAESPGALIERLTAFEAPDVSPWLGPKET